MIGTKQSKDAARFRAKGHNSKAIEKWDWWRKRCRGATKAGGSLQAPPQEHVGPHSALSSEDR